MRLQLSHFRALVGSKVKDSVNFFSFCTRVFDDDTNLNQINVVGP